MHRYPRDAHRLKLGHELRLHAAGVEPVQSSRVPAAPQERIEPVARSLVTKHSGKLKAQIAKILVILVISVMQGIFSKQKIWTYRQATTSIYAEIGENITN